MKRLILCVMMVAVAGIACADIEEFRHFSLDVPMGWTAVEDGAVVTVTADDKSGSLSITTGNPEGRDIGELAASFSNELNGTPPVSDDEGNYSFEFNNGVSQATITGDADFFMLIIGTGLVNNADTLGRILDSLEMK